MAPYTNIPLSPAELSYLHTSLSASPPIRPDGRAPTAFRPLVAESEILPSANGSARVCFADGTEAIVGIKAEVERTRRRVGEESAYGDGLGKGKGGDVEMGGAEEEGEDGATVRGGRGRDEWLEVAIDIPGMRDDDAMPVFLGAMLSEALLADGELKERLWINNRFHWRLYIDVSSTHIATVPTHYAFSNTNTHISLQVLLLSQPLSYPLPLLSLTTHLALLNTRLPSLISQGDEDPLFNDDWEASTPLYPKTSSSKPPVTLLVMSVGDNILFDPSTSELAVADSVLAISVSAAGGVVAMRTIDPPSRLTAAGVPSALNSASGAVATASASEILAARERDEAQSVWRPPRGGVKRGTVTNMVKMVVEKGGVGEEVMAGLAGVEV